ncbi:MAG: formylmethanofuran dehydrogenase subunit C [Gammaproteobacteria bacterium]|jgi:formylmethanofuran dehydrogenase subunit C
MSKVTLTLREAPAQRIDVSSLSLPRLISLSAMQISALPLHLGNHTVDVGELFDVAVTSSDEPVLVVNNSSSRLDGLAAGTVEGNVEVFGNAGAYLASDMTGGRVVVRGDCGAYAGTGMAAGQLHVHGSAGDYLAAALPGRAHGLQGGTIVIDGDAGTRAADRMRRGLLLIGGDVGNHCASRMIAGSVSVLGRVGGGAGFAMRRGTLLLNELPESLPATFNRTGTHDLTFINLWRKRIAQAGYTEHARIGHDIQRWVGDRAVGGLGEILLWR